MNKKTTDSRLQPPADLLGNHRLGAAKVSTINESNQPTVTSFLSWIDPPIGVNMSGIDTVHSSYKVSVMVVTTSTGGLLILPFAEPFAWNPMAAPPVRLQFQLTSRIAGRSHHERVLPDHDVDTKLAGQPNNPESDFLGSPSYGLWQSGSDKYGHCRHSGDHSSVRYHRLDQPAENRILPAFYACERLSRSFPAAALVKRPAGRPRRLSVLLYVLSALIRLRPAISTAVRPYRNAR